MIPQRGKVTLNSSLYNEEFFYFVTTKKCLGKPPRRTES